MIRVDDEFMTEVGLVEMPEVERQAFMEYAEEELEVRVGQEISEKLSDEQLEEFSSLTDEMVIADWLHENVPDFREVAEEVFRGFKAEIAENRAEFL